jgi:predicted ATP-dependent protease
VKDLMLRVAVVEAVAAGQFHIWAVETVDEGIEILTGVPADKIHTETKARLKNLAEILEQYRASASG